MIRRPPRSTQSRSSAASDVYKRQRMEIPADISAESIREGIHAELAYRVLLQPELFPLKTIDAVVPIWRTLGRLYREEGVHTWESSSFNTAQSCWEDLAQFPTITKGVGSQDADANEHELVHTRVSEYSKSIPHVPVSYTHLRAHETLRYLVCRLLLEKKKK